MKILRYLVVSIALMGLVACGGSGTKSSDKANEGTKTFKVDAGEDVTVEVNQTVTILGLVISSDNVTVQSYMWTKGNDILSRKASLNYVSKTVGKDTLTLTAITTDGRVATDSLVITVTKKEMPNKAPKVELQAYRTIDINTPITFGVDVNDSDGSIVKYVWTNNNVVVSNDENYTYTPTEFGEINIGLTVTDDDGAVASDTMVTLVTKRAFITEWEAIDKRITIPTTSEEKFDFRVEWGDGTFDENVSNTIEHKYKEKGTYLVRITGLFPSINFGKPEVNGAYKLTLVKQWGDTIWHTMHSAFSSCSKMNVVAKDSPNLSNVTDISNMFDGANSFKADISKWDVSHVTNMQAIFYSCWSFNQPLKDWNVSNVTDMSDMFVSSSFNQPIENWDVSNVTDMSSMFVESRFNQPIGNWDVSKVRDMSAMFYWSGFNQDISDWNISNVKSMGALVNQDIGWFSTENYDKLLIKWSKLSLQNDVNLEVHGLQYTINAKESRDLIISKFNWTIDDGGLVE